MTRANRTDAGPGTVWICTEGLANSDALRDACRGAGMAVGIVDAATLADRWSPGGRGVLVVADSVTGWPAIVRELRRRRPPVRVLLVSDVDERLQLVAALTAGVDGIVRHRYRPEAVLASIGALGRDEVSLPRDLTDALVGEIRSGSGRRVQSPAGEVRITAREWQILQFLLLGMSTGEMAAELYVADGTVRSHISALLGKLGFRTRADAMAFFANGDR